MINEEDRKTTEGDTLPTITLIMKETFQQQAAAMQQSVDDRSNTETADTIIGYLQ